jgi:hypothetical protein
MREFAGELHRWQSLVGPSSETPDLSAITSQIREQLDPTVQRQSERERLVQFGRQAVARVRERLNPLFAQLESDIPGAATHVRDQDIESILMTYDFMGAPELLLREGICARVSNQSEPLAYVLHLGALVEVLDSRELKIGAAFSLGHEQVMQADTDQHGPLPVEAGTVESEAAVTEVTDWLLANAAQWLSKFVTG